MKSGNIFSRLKQNRLFRDYLWVFLGQNIGSVFSMISIIVTLRIISTFEYGSLVIIQTYCLLVSNIFCMRTFNGTIKYVAKAEDDNDIALVKRYFNTAFLLDLLMGVIAFIFGFILLKPITIIMKWDLETVRFVNLYMPVILTYPFLNGAPVGILRKLGYFKHVNLIHASVYGLQLFCLVIIKVANICRFQVVLLIYASTEICESVGLIILSWIKLNRSEKYNNFWKAGLVKDFSFLKYNFSFGLLGTFDQILGNVSTLLINKYVGNLATAYLKIITRICSILAKITNPIGQIFYPQLCDWVAQKKNKKALFISIKYFVIVGSFGFLMVLIMYVTFDFWIQIFDPSMAAAKYQSILYMIYTLLSMSIICFNQLSFAIDMMKANLILVVFFDLLYLVLLIPCIKTFGVEGYLLLQIFQLIAVVIGKYLYMRRVIAKGE